MNLRIVTLYPSIKNYSCNDFCYTCNGNHKYTEAQFYEKSMQVFDTAAGNYIKK